MRTPILQNQQEKLIALRRDDGGKESILRCLAYFDIFRYPLRIDEIQKFMDQVADQADLLKWIGELQQKKLLFRHQDLYSFQDNPLVIHRRIEGEKRAARLLQKANKIGRFLYQFPFVRAVAVSGSLSKNFADEKADIDFFIIAKTNRLWIARTFMHLFKKLTFLVGRQHDFCMNYYVDESSLRLSEQNVYTAIELKTLLPVAGNKACSNFFMENDWSDQWLPSCDIRTQKQKDPRNNFFKQSWEWLLDNRVGNRLDQWLLKVTDRRWKRKASRGDKNQKKLPLNLICNKHFAKSNAGNFQEKVLKQFEEKVAVLVI